MEYDVLTGHNLKVHAIENERMKSEMTSRQSMAWYGLTFRCSKNKFIDKAHVAEETYTITLAPLLDYSSYHEHSACTAQ